MSEKKYYTPKELAKRWAGIVTLRTIYSWSQHPERGPKRAEDVRPPLVAYSVEAVEEFERTNPRLVLGLAKRAEGGAQ